MSFIGLLTESDLSTMKNDKKVFVIIIGGSASGKNYWYDSNLSFPLIDLDKIVYDLTGGDFSKTRSSLSKGISIATKQIDSYLSKGKSFAQVTTGAGAKAIENKIVKAQKSGFNVGLVLVDTDVKVAIKRMNDRTKLGKQSSIPEWKIEKTNKRAKETYESLNNMTEYSVRVMG